MILTLTSRFALEHFHTTVWACDASRCNKWREQ